LALSPSTAEDGPVHTIRDVQGTCNLGEMTGMGGLDPTQSFNQGGATRAFQTTCSQLRGRPHVAIFILRVPSHFFIGWIQCNAMQGGEAIFTKLQELKLV
jgi:hypothetical protein